MIAAQAPRGRRSTVIALALTLATACSSVRAPRPVATVRPLEASAPAAEAPRPRTLRRASGEVEVALESLAGRSELVVNDARVGATTLVRDGAHVRIGKTLRETWTLVPSNGSGGLRIEERTYPGRLRVSAGPSGGLQVRAVLDLEEYVAGVVSAELAVWSAPQALLEAQAIAARSFAVAELDHRGRSSGSPYLFDDTRDQAFRGQAAEAGGGAARVRAAVERTRGRVLCEGERVLDARYHAACGGLTAAGAQVFPENRFASLRPVECPPCAAARGTPAEFTWETTLARAELGRLAGAFGVGPRLTGLTPLEVDAGGRWITVELVGTGGRARVSFAALRAAVDPARLASSCVTSTWPRAGQPIEAGLQLAGRGRGHGVGLCQTGARGLAEAGWSAERILSHYYPGATVVDGR